MFTYIYKNIYFFFLKTELTQKRRLKKTIPYRRAIMQPSAILQRRSSRRNMKERSR